MIDRRDFILAAGSTVLAPLAAAHASNAPAVHTQRRLVLACSYPRSPAGTYDYAWRTARRIEHAMGHGTTIQVQDDPTGSIEALSSGAAHITLASEHANIALAPALRFIAGLPGRRALSAPPAVSALGHEHFWHAAHAQSGLQPIYAGREGAMPALWSAEPLSTLSGLKVAMAPGLCAEVTKAFGASPIAIAPSSRLAALAENKVNAVEMPSLEDALALGLQKLAPHYYEGVLAAHTGPLALTFAPQLWRTLPAAQRWHIRTTVLALAHARDAALAQQHNALRASLTACGVTQYPNFLPEAAIERISEAIIADYASRDGYALLLSGIAVAALPAQGETASHSTGHLNII